MAIGYSVDKPSIDSRLGAGVVAVRNALEDAARIDKWLDETPNEYLESVGYTIDEINLARSSYDAMAKLHAVAWGQESVPANDNFFYWAKRLCGLQ